MKYLSSTLVALVVASSLAGCGGGDSTQTTTNETSTTTSTSTTPSTTASATTNTANAGTDMPVVDPAKLKTTPSGLQYEDVVTGNGSSPQTGQQVQVHYTGWLTSGKKFDSSVDRGQPFEFTIGQGQVIKGWDEGVATMKTGGTRVLVIPAPLAYGERGAGADIPPNAPLIFKVQLLGVR